MIKVLRSTPIPVRPHIVFSLRTSYNLQTSSFLSDKSTKGKSYLAINLLCEAIVSLLTPSITALFRSEERRVGKECRSRWSPYH